jgi:PAS domain S-box-containing protein
MRENERMSMNDELLSLRRIIDYSPALLHSGRPDGYLDFFNRRWLEFTGQSLEKLVGWGWTSCIHPDDVGGLAQRIRDSLATGEPFQETSRVRRADGVYRWMLHQMIPMRDGSGKIVTWQGSSVDIDDRKRTEEQVLRNTQQLQRSDFYLAEAQRLGHIGTFGWRVAGGAITWSPETYRMFEIDPATEITLDTIMSRVHPEDRNLVVEAMKRASSEGSAVDFMHRLTFPDKRIRYLRVLAYPLEVHSDGLEYAGAVFDITEAKRAELQSTLNVIPAYTWYALPSGGLTFVNERTADYLGLPKGHPLRSGIDTGAEWDSHIFFLHPDDHEETRRVWSTCLRTGEAGEVSFRVRGADGNYRWSLSRAEPLRTGDGDLLYWIGVNLDIDELKKTESTLQLREQELLGIIDTIPSLLWAVSPSGEFTHISQRVQEYTGRSFGEFLNLGWKNIIHPDDVDYSSRAFFGAIESGKSLSVVNRLRRADGEYRWHHSRGEPLRDPQGTIIQWYGLGIDIDERKRAEDHLRDTRIKLARASRIATVAELSASIAHELSQPLMSILGNAQAAKRWLNAGPPNMTEVDSSIERIIRDARVADQTMQHIRALFKQESFEKKDVNIPDILREVVRIVKEDPRKREVSVECHFDALPPVFVDQIQIQQVFINLIVNAIEAMESANVAPIVRLQTSIADSNEVLIEVIDNGPGVADPEQIFDAFMTTKEKGMGIGLAVSRSIIDAHGGRIWCENNPGGGARFSVTIPISSAHQDKGEARHSPDQ